MSEELLKTVMNLGSPRILLVGDFMLDAYVYGDALRISPEAPVPVLKVERTEYRCGGAGSVADDLAALGAQPICVGVIGDDHNGDILKKMLTEAGCDVTGLLTVADRPTTTKQRLVGLAQHRHRQQLMRIDQESTQPLSAEQCEKILKAYGDRLPQVDIVCLQDHAKGLLSSGICERLIQLARQASRKVLVDPSLIKDYSKYTGATMITPNRKETSAAVEFEIAAGEDIVRAADELAEKLDIETVVITLDKEGAYLKNKQSSELIPTRPRSVYDVTGAGDMVLAMLATALAAGCDCKTAVQLSNIVGGIVVEKFGAASATIEEMIAEIASQDHGEGSKLLSVDCLVEALAWHRRGEKTIVFTNGCFDILHTGHVDYLDFAKSQGDVLVIGLNSDASVRIIKGPERPINGQDDRAAVLAALGSVDYIALFDEPTPLKLIERVKPDILVKGEDWADKGVVGREFVESRGGKVVLAPVVQGRSTTGTIEKIRGLGRKAKRQQQ